MKWQDFKGQTGAFGNVTFECENTSNGLRTITFSVDGKRVFMVGKGSYSDLIASVPAVPKKAKRFVLAGKFLGLAVIEEVFEKRYEADTRKSEFEKLANYPEEEKLGLSVEEREVEVDE